MGRWSIEYFAVHAKYRGKDKQHSVKNSLSQTRFGCLAKMKVSSRLTIEM